MAAEGSLLRKVISDLTGVQGSQAIRTGLNMNDAYNKNIDQIKFANQGNLWTQGEGKTLSEILDNADYRMKGNISWTSDIKLSNRANKNVFDYALRNFNYHQLNKTGEGTIQFYDKKTNKPIDWNTLPKNKNGFRVLKPNSVYFIDASMPNKKWDMTSIDADNMKWKNKTGSSGLFDEVFQAKDKYDKLLSTKVKNPKTKKKISFGKLMSEVYQKGFDNFGNPYAIEHADGVANNPFKNLKIASQRVNSALFSLNRDTKLAKSEKNKIFKELQKNVFNPADQNMIGNLIKSTQPLQSDVLVKGRTITGSELDNLRPLANIGCPNKKADGGRVNFANGQDLVACAIKGAEKLQNTDPTKLDPLAKANIKNLTKTASGARFLKNVLGPGAIAFEGLFALPFAALDFAEGRKGSDILKNALSLGLMDSKLREDELKEFFPGAGQADAFLKSIESLKNLQKQLSGTKKQRERAIPKYNIEFDNMMEKMQPFMRPNPQLTEGQFFDPLLVEENLRKTKDAEKDVLKTYDERLKEREIGPYAKPFDFSYGEFSNGGIAGLSGGDKSGPPPERGPDSEGLRSLMKRGINL